MPTSLRVTVDEKDGNNRKFIFTLVTLFFIIQYSFIFILFIVMYDK